jgi:thiamine kinase-like enzyme
VIANEKHLALLRAAYGERILDIEHLSGGLHGRCYRVRGADFDHAVRMPAPDAGEYRLDAADEHGVLARVAAGGLAPAAVETGVSFGLVATGYLEGARTWSPKDARQIENIDYLAVRLKALHALELDVPPYAGDAAAENYTRLAAERIELSTEQSGWRDELLQLACAYVARFPPECPCHNDLVASNVLDDGEIWLIDFEYAALSSPILDLAGLAGFNNFDTDQRARLIGAYYGHYDVPFSADELHDAIRLVRLLSYFWALSHGGAGKSNEDLANFADAMAAMLR